jgi:hypothetical protein
VLLTILFIISYSSEGVGGRSKIMSGVVRGLKFCHTIHFEQVAFLASHSYDEGLCLVCVIAIAEVRLRALLSYSPFDV